VDVDEQLADKIAQLDSAIQRRNTGKQERRSGTAGLDLAVKKLTAIIAELNAIMKAALRTSDPMLLAVWKDASRLYSDPVRTSEEESTLAAAPAPPSGATVASIESAPADEMLAPVQPRLNGNGSASVPVA
jgi:hypothetical protein